MSRISIITPTMGRSKLLIRSLDSLRAAIKDSEHEVEFIAVIDPDGETEQAIEDWASNFPFGEGIENLGIVGIPQPQRMGAIYCWNRGLIDSTGDYIVLGNDDFIYTPFCFDIALKAHREVLLNYGMVAFNDGWQDGNQATTHYLADRKFILEKLGGRIAFPIFNFYCNDTLAGMLAKKNACFYWCKEAVIQHMHYVRPDGGRPRDELDNENERNYLNEDIRRYEEWMRRGCNIEWTPVI